MQRFFKYLIFVCLVSAYTPAPAAACPDTALQALFNAKMGVQSGQITDAQQVFNLASEALIKCSDRHAEQVLAADLFARVGAAIPEDKDKFVTFSKAFEALDNSERAYDRQASTPIVTVNNQEQALNVFGEASKTLSFVVKELAELGILLSEFHPIFIQKYETDAQCPRRFDSRAEAEAEGFLAWSEEKRGQLSASPNILYRRMALHRLEGLWALCPTFHKSSTLAYVIAKFNLELAGLRKEDEPKEALINAEKAIDFGQKFKDLTATRSDVKYLWRQADDKAASDLKTQLQN